MALNVFFLFLRLLNLLLDCGTVGGAVVHWLAVLQKAGGTLFL